MSQSFKAWYVLRNVVVILVRVRLLRRHRNTNLGNFIFQQELAGTWIHNQLAMCHDSYCETLMLFCYGHFIFQEIMGSWWRWRLLMPNTCRCPEGNLGNYGEMIFWDLFQGARKGEMSYEFLGIPSSQGERRPHSGKINLILLSSYMH